MKIITYIPGLMALFFLADLQAQPVLNISTMSGNQVMLSWAVTNTGFGLEYADNPASANWTQVKANVINALCVVMDNPTSSARFYRLVSPFGANQPPMLPDGKPIYVQGDPYYPDAPLYVDVASISDGNGLHFDATEVIDPASPTNNSLSYLWTVDSNNLGDDLISPYITGTATPILSIEPEVVPNGEYLFYITVTSNYSHLSTTWEIDANNIVGGEFSVHGYGAAVPRSIGHLYGYSEVVGFY